MGPTNTYSCITFMRILQTGDHALLIAVAMWINIKLLSAELIYFQLILNHCFTLAEIAEINLNTDESVNGQACKFV